VRIPLLRKTSRVSVLLALAVVALGVSGCGVEHRTDQKNVSQDELAAGGEPYFWAGAISYQVQITRQLNPYSGEDVQYLAGIHNAQNLPPNQLWFGVFLWAKNQSGIRALTARRFAIVDSEGTVFTPVALNPSINPYAWTQRELAPDAIEPALDTTASWGPTGGGLILFRLNNAVYSNRPLTLLVYAPGSHNPSRVSLDL
jgi:hypothetical protein